ncbi:type IV pilus assembly protein PilV [Variovorax soli]|uniref:Type IV pilus assembly protein PilV n=2 Tax=Variovorax soli TaxID=376815 RepID=A0ABU1N9Y2_9BURK|nr:type IV pilus assembly protein PilV [Variovorax soli]
MKRMPHPLLRAQAGMALIEVLVSILLFSLGILGMIGLQTRAMNFSVDATDRNRAALLANEIATTMWLNNSIAVDTSAGTAWATRIADVSKDGLPSATATVVPVTTLVNTADITIEWVPPQRNSTDKSRLTTRVTLPPPP